MGLEVNLSICLQISQVFFSERGLIDVDLQAHPNPTTQNTEITIIIDPETIAEPDQVALASGVTMQLADVSGKILKTQNIGAYDHTPIPIDLQDLSQGIYYVKVFTADGKLIGERKIIRRSRRNILRLRAWVNV